MGAHEQGREARDESPNGFPIKRLANIEMKIKRVISGAIVVAFVALLFFVVRPSAMRVDVKFIALTNLTSMDITNYNLHPPPCANFYVSNAGKCSVLELPICGFDYKNDPVASGTRWGGWDGLRSELKPGESKTVSVTVLNEDDGPWRVSLSFYKIGWKYRLITHSPTWVVLMLPDKWLYQYHSEEFKSDWVPSPDLHPDPHRWEVFRP